MIATLLLADHHHQPRRRVRVKRSTTVVSEYLLDLETNRVERLQEPLQIVQFYLLCIGERLLDSIAIKTNLLIDDILLDISSDPVVDIPELTLIFRTEVVVNPVCIHVVHEEDPV